MSVLNWKLPPLYKKQQEIYDSKVRRITVMAGRQAGKTTLMFQIAIRELVKGKYKSGKYVSVLYVTPKLNLAELFFKEFLALLPEDIIIESNATKRYIKIITGAEITFKGAEAGITSFRGFRHSLVICDEFAFYKGCENLWLEGIEPSMMSYKRDARAYFVSTPLGQNYFYTQYLRGKNEELGYESFYFTSLDNPYLDKDFIENKRKELPQIIFEQEYLALPSANASNPFGLHINKNIIPELSKKRSEVFGIDLAKTVDFTVLLGLATGSEGVAEMSYFDRFQKEDWNFVKDKIRALPRNVDKLIDSTGVGDPILDDLKLSVPNIKGFKFNTQSKQNLIKEFIKAVEIGAIKYTQAVADEMNVYTYKYNPVTGHCKYGSQESYHDDIVTACALAWWQYNRRTRRNNSWCIGTA
ncbi:hypothetical protein GEO21_22370 [Sphingobacterium faecium]|uniref:terminase large subunit domain-containing protein n=1 Tax=Sphingobacterium faecium TaxID=34087 RepID=UPI0012919A2F|nr:terminase family protein [Sphingobacterium faecium]MQP30233.1 hypothetical protein [Sphingobacterium faecium]